MSCLFIRELKIFPYRFELCLASQVRSNLLTLPDFTTTLQVDYDNS